MGREGIYLWSLRTLCAVMVCVLPLLAVTRADAADSVAFLPYDIVKQEKIIRPTTGRDRLDVVIVPSGNQSLATAEELEATVKHVARTLGEKTGLPVVTVTMLAQLAASEHGEPMLATVTCIPDGKGYDGKQAIGPWDGLLVAPRGFTGQELEYLRLWAEMRENFQKDGVTDEEALDAAVSRHMGLDPETLDPFLNIAW